MQRCRRRDRDTPPPCDGPGAPSPGRGPRRSRDHRPGRRVAGHPRKMRDMWSRLLVAHSVCANVNRSGRARAHTRFAPTLALLALALSAGPAHAQFFNGVYSRDAIDVIAVADSGALYRSTSSGVAWTRTA